MHNQKTTLIQALSQLGQAIERHLASGDWEGALNRATALNPWFTKENSRAALRSLAAHCLQPELLHTWLSAYPQLPHPQPKTIGLVLAGNIPLVGFHDWLCVLVSGHRALVKCSEKDKVLLPLLWETFVALAPSYAEQTQFVERLKGFDAVIATGSDNTGLYFQQYFGRYPHIIRQNRNSIAVLTGQETEADWAGLATDVFRYFGLGCRSVSKLLLPQGYDLLPLLAYLDHYADMMQHNKYKNNYDYNRSLYLLNNVHHYANDCIMLVESPSLLSRIATLHYEFYADEQDLANKLAAQANQIQCIVGTGHIPFGQSQHPQLWDYADGVDTLAFLGSL